MAHMIDETNGRAAIAYAGQTPWHGLGVQLLPTDSPEVQRRKAGLEWSALDGEVLFRRRINGSGDTELVVATDRKAIYRDDTGDLLSIMTKDYHQVQPGEIFALYQNIAKATGFALETAGGLSGGKRIWALLKVSEGAEIVGHDQVKPYVLLATSYDGSMATTGAFTAVRVVCHNTISMVIPQFEGAAAQDYTGGGRHNGKQVRVLHTTKWTDEVAKEVRMDLGIAADSFERFAIRARALSGKEMDRVAADAFVQKLLEPYWNPPKDVEKARVKNIRDTKGYRRIMALFQGEAKGAEIAGPTRWGMLNAVTEFVDHERGLTDSSRLDSAWFGTGAGLKERAFAILEGEFEVVR